jgi:hypothetical protein
MEEKMKIYLYDEESGLYLGEDFIDTSEVAGVCELPENATLVRPPETGSKQVAVFIKESNRWDIRNKGNKSS